MKTRIESTLREDSLSSLKLFKKKLAHNYPRTKLVELWKPSEPLTLVDLENDYYIAKFTNQENIQMALHGGPWFITVDFLSVRHWEPNFIQEGQEHPHCHLGKVASLTN